MSKDACGARPEFKDEILRAFEPTLIEAAQASTPDSFSAARRRWADKFAHHIDQDGPPVVDTLRKPADNTVRTQDYTDGSGKIWLHATPAVYAEFKQFAINQLNHNGTPIALDEALVEFLHVPDDSAKAPQSTDDEQEAALPRRTVSVEDLTIDRDLDQPVAEDDDGTTVSQNELNSMES